MLEAEPMRRQEGARGLERLLPPARARWFLALSSLLTAVMIGSTVSVLEELWWEETYTIVYVVLAVSALLELLPVRRLLRLPAQLLAVVVVVLQLAPVDWSTQPPQAGIGETIRAGAELLHPFWEIALAVWVVYAMFAAWNRARIRIIGFTTVNLLVLAISDSFTPIYLWDSVAIVVFSGLVWLVAEHYAGFQQRHPVSWRRLLRYPLQLLLPIVLVLSLVMAAGLAAPEIPPLLKDPYTAWQESRGLAVQNFVGDKGIAPASSKKSAKSGYSRDDSKLGGGFNFDYSPVMEVTSTHKSYWRGETKDYYSGEGWKASESLNAVIDLSPNTEIGNPVELTKAETVEIGQTFKMLREDKFPVLFAAPSVLSVHLAEREDGVRVRILYDYGQEKLIPDPTQNDYPSSYAIRSEQVVLTDELKLAPAAMQGSIASYFTQVPSKTPSRVADLAREITAGASSDYDKAKAIETYLSTTYPYTNEPDLTKKKSADFVDSFLFEIQEGYCDYFSSAMAVLARSVGLPSRWVKGYAPGSGTIDPEAMMRGGREAAERVDSSGEDTYTVRNSDAHSWVEIYFEGYGWIPFEPTPGFAFPYASAAAEEAPEPSALPVPSEAPQPTEAPTDAAGPLLPRWLGWTGLGLLAAAAAGFAFLRREQLAALWRGYRTRSLTAEQRIVWETERLIRSARRHGLAKAEHETLREAVERWSGQRRFLKQELSEVLALFERTKYGARPATREEADSYAAKIRELSGRLRSPG
ncbi:transglutaminase domain-containing protein [Paenibacillus albicereus]|uniref:Transglutaminase domain-containing protein n=1 Tax=Paenibacillus albicereus TaxID=2726185 RepID=A0A6H2GZ36_9BACL|nr:transglutaminase domain-containing protein [Paenibacillus albicereus]QJC52657.1 transglutaminase domain-containing protein [Paenibacillus albicereus]